MTATQLLGEWSASAGGWSEGAVTTARQAILDTTGCVLAGMDSPPARAALRVCSAWSGSGAQVPGTDRRLPSPWAALVAGAAAHALDYDDALTPALSHPSAALVPAILALGEETGATLGEAIDAYVVGIEVASQLGLAMNTLHYQLGWHTTLSIGASSVAAACGRLVGLDGATIATAISISTSLAAGSKCHFGTDLKPTHAGLAAHNGIFAARLAEAGLSAAREALEGEWGLVTMTTGPRAPGFSGLADRLAGRPAIEEHGGWFKRHSCCAATHRPVDALLAIRDARGFGLGNVEAINVWISPMARANLKYVVPETSSQARFSLPFCLVQALDRGDLLPPAFAPNELERPDLRAAIARVRVHVDASITEKESISEVIERARLQVMTRTGETFEETIVDPKGFPGNRLDEGELEAKFRACAAACPSIDAQAVMDFVHGPPDGRLVALAALLRASSQAGAATG